MQVQVDVKGIANCRKNLNSLAAKIANPDRNLMRRLGETSLDDVDKRFMTGGYGTWKPLSPKTIKRKGHGFILIDTGAMYASVKIVALELGRVVIKVMWGGKSFNPLVPVFHQRGTRRMPQRKIIEITSQLTTALKGAVSLWISDMVKAWEKTID